MGPRYALQFAICSEPDEKFLDQTIMSNSPNILFIVADQHNAKVLGHKGHPDARTPHLDRMACEGPLQPHPPAPSPKH